MSERRLRPTLIFDADDTIWPCHEYYLLARKAIVERIHYRTALSESVASALVASVESSRKTMDEAFLRPSLGKSYYASLCAAAALRGARMHEEEFRREANAIADTIVWNAPYPIFDGVLDLFTNYRLGGWQVLIATKGDPIEQQKKLDNNDVPRHVDGSYITPHKTPAFYAQLCNERLVDLSQSVMIGDSMESDILPAQAANIAGTVWISNDHAWGSAPGKPTAAIASVLELPSLIPFAAPDGTRL